MSPHYGYPWNPNGTSNGTWSPVWTTGTTAGNHTITVNGVYVGPANTPIPPPPEPVEPKEESVMEWLDRRVDEVRELAYA